MTTSTLTLTTFLLARIAEDEAVARDHLSRHGCEPYDAFSVSIEDCGEMSVGMRRWLAECETKRRIVERTSRYRPRAGESEYAEGVSDGYGNAVRHLATPYADHPDYREEWRP